MREVSIWCDEIIAFSSLSAIVERYIKRGFEVTIYTPRKNVAIAQQIFYDANVISIQSVDRKLYFVAYNIYLLFFVNNNFSGMFARVKLHKFGVWLYNLSRILKLFKLNPNSHIRFLNVFKVRKNVFASNRVISLSRISRPYLFNCKDLHHIAIMESWDHPVKAPWFISPRAALTWNKDLKQDIVNYQKISSVFYINPIKFSYIFSSQKYHLGERNEKLVKSHYKGDLKGISQEGLRKMIVYAMAYSEQNVDAFRGELEFVKLLAAVCVEHDFLFFVKPKPLNGGNGIKSQLSGLDGVMVGSSPIFDQGIDLLSKNYNAYRKRLLTNASLVIDCGSTFMIDASLHGCAVVKLEINAEGFSNSFDATKRNPHLKHLSELSYEFNGGRCELENLVLNYKNYDISKDIKLWLSNQ